LPEPPGAGLIETVPHGEKAMRTLYLFGVLALGVAGCGYGDEGYNNDTAYNEGAAYNEASNYTAEDVNYTAEDANYSANAVGNETNTTEDNVANTAMNY
jgi:hypothetical protein